MPKINVSPQKPRPPNFSAYATNFTRISFAETNSSKQKTETISQCVIANQNSMLTSVKLMMQTAYGNVNVSQEKHSIDSRIVTQVSTGQFNSRILLFRPTIMPQLGRQVTGLSPSLSASSSASKPLADNLYPMLMSITSSGSAFMRFWFALAASSEFATSLSFLFPSYKNRQRIFALIIDLYKLIYTKNLS